MQAAGYLRRSVSRDQSREVSREIQEQAVIALAQRHGETITNWYIDWGMSGRRDDRPQYQAMLSAIEAGQITSLYAYSLSRLGRSVVGLASLIRLCASRNVPVRLVADAIDTSTASGVMMSSILASVAQFESDVASERAKAASLVRQERGDQIGRPAFGSRDDDDADALLRAFREAGSYSGAARLLNKWDVKPRNAKQWAVSSVSTAFHRLYPDEAPPYRRRGARARSKHALSGLVACPAPLCKREGTLLIATTDPKERLDRVPRKRLVCRFASHRSGHTRSVIAESRILPFVRKQVDALAIPDRIEADIIQDNAKLREIELRRGRLYDAIESGVITLADVKDRIAALDAEAASIERQSSLVEIPRIDWENWHAADINDVLSRLIDRVELDILWRPKAIYWIAGIEDWVPPAM